MKCAILFFFARVGLLIYSILLCSSCATAYKDVLESYEDAPICCTSIKNLDYEKIAIGESRQVPMNEKTQAFLFDSGKSYFKALELPAFSKPYHVMIDSYALGTAKGPDDSYVYFPTLMTLDNSFSIVRLSDTAAFQVRSVTPDELFSKMPFSSLGRKLVGQLPFTVENADEKYLIIFSTEDSMKRTTVLKPQGIYYWQEPWIVKNSPTGALTVSLVDPKELNRYNRNKWLSRYEEVNLRKRYDGNWFSVLPPQNVNYRFLDLSSSPYGKEYSHLDFAKYKEGEGSGGFVKSYQLGSLYKNLNANKTLAIAVESAEDEHRINIVDVRYEKSEIKLGEANCRRIDYFGKSKHMLLLPTRGYDILCIHPNWSEKFYPLLVRIGAQYVFPLNEATTHLPTEILNFYMNVRFEEDK